MKIAILCPGPSVSHFDGPDEYDAVIGINRAATFFRVDVWGCGDYPAIDSTRDKVIGLPLLLTAANSSANIRDRGVPWLGGVVEFESMYDGSEHSLKWPMFTATAALWYAHHQGAKLVRVFGADWKGVEDADGVKAGGNRSDERWALERFIWGEIVKVIERDGGVVERVIQ